MQCALRRCEELGPIDRLAREVAPYYRRHIDEERDHDHWTLEDLASAGLDPKEVLSIIPPPDVAQLAGAQYYWIHHHHPIMLMGYIAVLEAFPPTKEQVDTIRDASGLPESAFRTLRMHGELDPTHSIEIDDTLNALPLSRMDNEMIGLSVLQTCESLAESVQALRPRDLMKSDAIRSSVLP
ncbi:iron-containing redox enzyme family protein [Neomesorhizobium albiziae]|nr:iron-containing redox enzyme family protein [Mesorhizobium albiziae]